MSNGALNLRRTTPPHTCASALVGLKILVSAVQSRPRPPIFSRTSAYSLALKYSHCFFCSAMKFVKRGLPRMLSRLVSFSNSV